MGPGIKCKHVKYLVARVREIVIPVPVCPGAEIAATAGDKHLHRTAAHAFCPVPGRNSDTVLVRGRAVGVVAVGIRTFPTVVIFVNGGPKIEAADGMSRPVISGEKGQIICGWQVAEIQSMQIFAEEEVPRTITAQKLFTAARFKISI